jgi:glycosyltransferase involved in cell wall biosynthesis
MVKPFITIIVPCRNEEKYISLMLDNIVLQDYNKSLLEVFIIDGMSTDSTPGIIKRYSDRYNYIRYLKNENKEVSYALNLGILESKGEVIIRMDAHCVFPPDYVSALVDSLLTTNADNVGGIIITVPADDTLKSLAISKGMSSPFGVGMSEFRIGAKRIMKVSTVPFGCYRREVFDKVGLFDIELVRNQDDEFNGRLVKSGGSIILIPDIKIKYYARDRLSRLFLMMYQYGFFKPLVNIKLGSPATIRQFFPPLFTFYLLFVIPFVLSFSGPIITCYMTVLALYLTINLFFSMRIALIGHSLLLFFYMVIIFFIMHIGYGFGYIIGMIKFVFLKQRITNKPINSSK